MDIKTNKLLEEFNRSNKPKRKHRKRYLQDPNKLNLIEIKRRMNYAEITDEPNPHCSMLFKLGGTKKKLMNFLQTKKKMEDEGKKKIYPYTHHPEITENSKDIMRRKSKNMHQRNEIFLMKKKMKLESQRKEKELKIEEMELRSMIPFKGSGKIKVESKVKLYLDGKLDLEKKYKNEVKVEVPKKKIRKKKVIPKNIKRESEKIQIVDFKDYALGKQEKEQRVEDNIQDLQNLVKNMNKAKTKSIEEKIKENEKERKNSKKPKKVIKMNKIQNIIKYYVT